MTNYKSEAYSTIERCAKCGSRAMLKFNRNLTKDRIGFFQISCENCDHMTAEIAVMPRGLGSGGNKPLAKATALKIWHEMNKEEIKKKKDLEMHYGNK